MFPELAIPILRPLEWLTSTTPLLMPLAVFVMLKRAIWTRYIVFRMWILDEELSRIQDSALTDIGLDDEEKLTALRAQPRVKWLLQERSRLVRLTYRFGEVYGLKLDRRLRRNALRYGVVSIPKGAEYHTASQITERLRLNAHGIAQVRGDIRAEKQARREPWLAWLPWILAIGAAVGWIYEAFFRKGPPSP